MPRRIVLISDLQQGSRLDALGDFEWPSDVELDLKTVAADGPNAGLQWLAGRTRTSPSRGDGRRRSASGSRTTGTLAASRSSWPGSMRRGRRRPTSPPTSPPARAASSACPDRRPARRAVAAASRATPTSSTTPSTSRRGPDEATVLYLGADAPDDPSGLLYYLDRVFEDTPVRTVKVVATAPTARLAIDPAADRAPLDRAGGRDLGRERRDASRAFAERAGPCWSSYTRRGRRRRSRRWRTVAAWPIEESPAGTRRDARARSPSTIRSSPRSPAPQFNDFTKIRFWKYRRIADRGDLGEARVLARFERGDPAVIEKPMGKGRLVVLTSGWAPGRQPARPVVEVRAADGGACSTARADRRPTSSSYTVSATACRVARRGEPPSTSRTDAAVEVAAGAATFDDDGRSPASTRSSAEGPTRGRSP